jgi:hypothetical protein
MNEFKQFRRFAPRFWQEDGIVTRQFLEGGEERPRPRRLRQSRWAVSLAVSAIAFSSVIVSMPFSLSYAGAATRKATITEEAAQGYETSIYTEVSPDHWVRLRDLIRGFPRTPKMDRFKDPEPVL